MKTTTEELPNGKPERLALDVPKGDVDAAHGMEPDTAPATVDIAPVHLVPDLLGLEGVLPENQFTQATGCRMGIGPIDRALSGDRIGVDFA